MHTFTAALEIIGVNPYVRVPVEILQALFQEAGRDKGPIPIRGLINGTPYRQTLVRYKGEWRLYVNMMMLPQSPKRIGEVVEVSVAFDPSDRSITPHPRLVEALEASEEAKQVFNGLPASRQHEIVRYIASLKTEESVERNVKRAIGFLTGKERFVGREKP